MHAHQFLLDAATTMQDRAKERDVLEERSMEKVVELFNSLHGTDLSEAQGWNFMVLLKMVRAHTGGNFRVDDYVDQIAYLGLEAECRSEI